MEPRVKAANLIIGSTAFGNKDHIPAKFTCDGENINPGITVEDIPAGTKSLTLIVEDSDAQGGNFVHWVLWNVRPMEMIIENTAPGVQGKNNFGKTHYMGPCPPEGHAHRYFFKVYAVDKILDVHVGADKETVVRAMKDHILAEGEIIGLYKRMK